MSLHAAIHLYVPGTFCYQDKICLHGTTSLTHLCPYTGRMPIFLGNVRSLLNRCLPPCNFYLLNHKNIFLVILFVIPAFLQMIL